MSDTDALVYYKIGDPLARREIFLTRKRGRYTTKAMDVSDRWYDWLHDGCASGREPVRWCNTVLFCFSHWQHALDAGDGGGQSDAACT